ncbi:MAG: DNA repair protein RecO [Candidatus Sericytochromatia bacterium]|nr:DNA repair protein RecO [Candidatus Sericytochromatia bacterium]
MDDRQPTFTAFVLRQHAVGEADRVLVLLTRERGLRRALARGLRKAGSRLGGRLEAFREASVTLVRGRNLDVVAGAESLRRFPAIATDFDALAAGLAATELLLAFLADDDPQPEAYDLYATLLGRLGPGSAAEVLLCAFELQLLDALGYRPELAACTACGAPLAGPVDLGGLDLEGGGVVCAGCEGLMPVRPRRLSWAARELLLQLRALDLAAGQPPDVAVDLASQARSALKAYSSLHAERELKAQRMFDWKHTP